MKIAITGASGLIGTRLARQLRTSGHTVVTFVRRPPRGSDEVAWDPGAGEIDRAGLDGVDGVVHLAGAAIADGRWTQERKRELLTSRTVPTELLARTLAGLDRPPRVLLSASATGYYGERGDEVLTERSTPGDDFLADVCVAWEGATAAASDAGIRVTNLRTGIVLTPDGGALPKFLPLFKLGLGGRFGSGRQWFSWISLADELGAIEWLLDHDVAGPVNLTAPLPVTNADFAKTLARVLHRPALLPVPSFGPKLVVGSELAQALIFTSARVEPEALLAAGYPFRHAELFDALRDELGK